MPISVIHVYHEHGSASASPLARLVESTATDRRVCALRSLAELAAALPEIEVLLAPAPPRTGWANAHRLRLIQVLGVGVDTLLPSPDLPAAVAVAGVRGVFAPDVVEHVLALMLAHARRLPELYAQQAARRWVSTPRTALAGQRLAIVGYGAIGRRLAHVARALDMEVVAISRTGSARGDGVEVVATSDIADAITDASYVVLAAPLTPQTRGLFDARLLARMRSDTYLIDVARGGIVDEHALAGALAAGQLGGAALDVFAEEPLPQASPLWSTPHLTITPHVAGLGERYVERCVERLLANVAALDAGRALEGLVDRDVGY